MTAIRSVCVYCGSHVGRNRRYREAAVGLGRLLAKHGIRLVYGGGRIGLMGEVADAVIADGGEVVGIIPEMLESQEVGHRGISELRVVTSMHERKNLMFEMADGFVILPGGLGTLDETFEMLTWRQLRLHDKPIVVVDIDGYWQPFEAMVEHIIASGFAAAAIRSLYRTVPSVEALFEALAISREPAVAPAPDLV
jgi:hypothetical protein